MSLEFKILYEKVYNLLLLAFSDVPLIRLNSSSVDGNSTWCDLILFLILFWEVLLHKTKYYFSYICFRYRESVS